MELEKSTTLAGVIWVAGILAMILFQDVFAGSTVGIVLGIVLAVVILVATYFIIDGISLMIRWRGEKESLQQQAYEDKMLEIMKNELQQLVECEKTTLAEIQQLKEANEKSQSEEPAEASLDTTALEEMAEKINHTTMQAAKIIVKYSKSSTSLLQQEIEDLKDQI